MDFPFPVSPSQINTARQCWRKYGLDYIDQVETEQNPYAALGTEMHGYLEDWFKHGKLPPIGKEAGQMARVALLQWPAPTRVDECEIHIGAETDTAVYHGYQDIGHLHRKMQLRVVGDHKSCGDHKWNKTKEDLKKDPQCIIYAAAAMIRYKVDRVICKWVYTTRGKKPKSKVVQLIMTQADVEAGFDSIDETAKDIYMVRTMPGITGMDLPPNPTACGMFGGCGHIERCNLSPRDKLRGYMSQMSLRDKIAANKKAKEAGQTVATPAGKPVVDKKPAKAAAKTEETAKEKMARLKAEKAAKKAEEEEEDLAISDDDEEVVDDTDDEDETEAEAPPPPPPKTKPTGKPTATKSKPDVHPAEETGEHAFPDKYTAVHKGHGRYVIEAIGLTFDVEVAPRVKVVG